MEKQAGTYQKGANVSRSYVVTGGRDIGRAVVERLLDEGSSVVVIALDPDALSWTHNHPAGRRVMAVAGSGVRRKERVALANLELTNSIV